jgi:hypothetical protein
MSTPPDVTVVPGVTPGAGGVMTGGGWAADAGGANAAARHMLASATVTASDAPARRHLRTRLAGLAEATESIIMY